MPQTHPTATGLPPAPVALLLRPTHTHRPIDATGQPLPDWYGIHPDHLVRLIARYSAEGDTVLDTDAHPTVAAAAQYLFRRPGLAVTAGEHQPVWPDALDRPPLAAARLVLATLPRLGTDTSDVHALSRTLGAWRELLRPGGFVVLLTAGPGTGALGHRSTVIAAARAAGLLYHQHIPALLVPLPETEPRTEPRPTATPPLADGRHARTHRDLLVFTTTAAEATDA